MSAEPRASCTHASLPESKRPGILLGLKEVAKHKGWVEFPDSIMRHSIYRLPTQEWTRCLDAVTQQIVRRVSNASVERSPTQDPDVADWQVKKTLKRFTLVVECVARKHADEVRFEIRRFILRPSKQKHRMGGKGLLVAWLIILVGGLGFLSNPEGWKESWVKPVLIAGAVVLVASWSMRDTGVVRGGGGPSYVSEEPAVARIPVTTGIESESHSLLMRVNDSVLDVVRDQLS